MFQECQYRSRPDLAPPKLSITIPSNRDKAAPGYLFVTPCALFDPAPNSGPEQPGAHIFRDDGDLVWSSLGYLGGWTANFQATRYKDRPVLQAFQGCLARKHAHAYGTPVLLDQSYQPVTMVQSLNKLISFHEFRIVNEKTALVQIQQPILADLTVYGGSKDQKWIVDDIFQEVDIETGETLFEGHPLKFADPSDSLVPLNLPYGTAPNQPWDFFHTNSVDKDPHGNYLVSGRHISTIYKLSGTDGSLLWRLSTANSSTSSFQPLNNLTFSYQHHARFRSCATSPDGAEIEAISFFDNAARSDKQTHGHPPEGTQMSSGKVVQLNHKQKTAELMAKYEAPDGGLSVGSQGNMQFLPNGNKFINWGVEGAVTEFDNDGRVLFHAFLDVADQRVQSYRGFKYEWEGRPREKIAVLAMRESRDGQDSMEVYVSWNGDTVTKVWKFFAEDEGKFQKIGSVERMSFETRLEVTGDKMTLFRGRDTRVFAVAMDRKGVEIGRSDAVEALRLDE
ncbi:Arylsulfotransferase [Triangularia setosa]|uniref:Arylsulfotransferase n=1 Tax=Triangularia setosa TaxID=2587417 RepID=A0AAN6VXD2_9PEZI|nr:Arylsulfotransferase [Podospora setosa]